MAPVVQLVHFLQAVPEPGQDQITGSGGNIHEGGVKVSLRPAAGPGIAAGKSSVQTLVISCKSGLLGGKIVAAFQISEGKPLGKNGGQDVPFPLYGGPFRLDALLGQTQEGLDRGFRLGKFRRFLLIICQMLRSGDGLFIRGLLPVLPAQP